MKKITELTKNELINFIYNNIENFSINSNLSCSACGYPDADWYYICDECNKSLEKE